MHTLAKLLQVGTEGSGVDWTQVVVTGIVTVGVIVTAVFSFLGVRAGRAAKVEAQVTRTENTADHGRVAAALEGLRAEAAELRSAVVGLRSEVKDVGRNVGTLRDQFIGHLQDEINRRDQS